MHWLFFFILYLAISCSKDEFTLKQKKGIPDARIERISGSDFETTDGARACRIFQEWVTSSADIRSLDILFMLDDSESMSDNIRTMAKALNLFFPILEETGIHFCTGIMLGYADDVAKSGKFISLDDDGIQVMCRDKYTVDDIVSKLSQTMLKLPLSGSSGEAGLYSLKEAITTNLEARAALAQLVGQSGTFFF